MKEESMFCDENGKPLPRKNKFDMALYEAKAGIQEDAVMTEEGTNAAVLCYEIIDKVRKLTSAVVCQSNMIEKMKCCGNCKHYVDDNCDLQCPRNCYNYDEWELKE